jgi:hypothetical protein
VFRTTKPPGLAHPRLIRRTTGSSAIPEVDAYGATEAVPTAEQPRLVADTRAPTVAAAPRSRIADPRARPGLPPPFRPHERRPLARGTDHEFSDESATIRRY